MPPPTLHDGNSPTLPWSQPRPRPNDVATSTSSAPLSDPVPPGAHSGRAQSVFTSRIRLIVSHFPSRKRGAPNTGARAFVPDNATLRG